MCPIEVRWARRPFLFGSTRKLRKKKLELILEFLIEISVSSFYFVYYAQTYSPVYTDLFYNHTNIHSTSGSKMCLSFQKEEIK